MTWSAVLEVATRLGVAALGGLGVGIERERSARAPGRPASRACARHCCSDFSAGSGLRVLRTRRALVLENLALRHQLAVLQRAAPRPRLRRSDRLFWVLLSQLWSGWADAVSIV